MINGKVRVELRCPEVVSKVAGDESYDMCGLNGYPCIIGNIGDGGECEIFNEYLIENNLCPKCFLELEYFSGLPEYLFCPRCMDWAYYLDGQKLARLI